VEVGDGRVDSNSGGRFQSDGGSSQNRAKDGGGDRIRHNQDRSNFNRRHRGLHNILKHAGCGEILLSSMNEDDGGPSLEMTALDRRDLTDFVVMKLVPGVGLEPTLSLRKKGF
jgi:hypothetical protein